MTDDGQHADKRDYSVDRGLLRVSAVAMLIGALGTVVAYVLLDLIRFFTNLFFYQAFSPANSSPAQNTMGAWVILVPVLGGVIVGLVARFGSDKIRGHGIPEAMEAILFAKSKMSPKVAVLKPLSSGVVIGSGGPFGAEGPIIMTGGSIGSLLAQYMHLTAAERKTLLVAGACAGMTGIFGTPVAALLLAVELLLFELRPRSLLPVALACGVAGFLRPLLFDAGALFPLQTAPPSMVALGSCLVAGLLCGALAVVLTYALHQTEEWFEKLPVHWMWWPAIGGLVVGIGGYLEPRALGVGYDVIDDLLNNRLLVSSAVLLLAAKAVMWVTALGSGTSGGVLAPLLTLGAGLGVVLAQVLPGGSPGLWALVCMAAVLGSVLGAPLMAVVFALGLTHDTEALLPLLLTTVVAYGVTVLAMKRSIMTEKIARRGLHINREYGIDPLERQYVVDLMNKATETIDAQLPLARAQQTFFGAQGTHQAYPVVQADGRLLGVLDRRTVSAMPPDERPCSQLLEPLDPRDVLLPGYVARHAAGRMAARGANMMCVVENTRTMRLVGVLTVRDLLEPSHVTLQEETVRERLR